MTTNEEIRRTTITIIGVQWYFCFCLDNCVVFGDGESSSLPLFIWILNKVLFRLKMKKFWMSHRICRKDVGRGF